jgi:hypothetical protein
MSTYLFIDPVVHGSGLYYAECKDFQDALEFFTAKAMDQHNATSYRPSDHMEKHEYCFCLTRADSTPVKTPFGAIAYFVIHKLADCL